jgi:hypothetical protein
MENKWPVCPDCGFCLVYIVGRKVFSCACGEHRPVGGFLKKIGIDESELGLDAPDLQQGEQA